MTRQEKIENCTSEWTAPNGQIRRYVSLVKTGLLEVEKYKSGSISSASWDGSQISNSEAGRLLGTKFYFVGEELFQKGNAACQRDYIGDLKAFFA
ncbi:MAG: hypothetical protein WCS21_10140 [Lachnospiraceae bacterium]